MYLGGFYMAVVEKHFPADTSMEMLTFLNNKNIDGRLYAYLQSKSMPVVVENNGIKNYETRVDKFEIGSQNEFCKAVKIKSTKTLRKYLNILINTGYIEDMGEYYVLPKKETIFFKIPLETLRFIQNTIKEDVIKIYIYLGQRYKYASINNVKYSFTLKEVAEHLGLSVNSENSRVFVKDGLDALMNNGLIEFVSYYEGRIPKLRLVNFSYDYKTNFNI